MADKTGIEWTDATWNPVLGCDKVSPGCDNCYAISMSARIQGTGNPDYQGIVAKGGPKLDTLDWTGKIRTIPARLDQPLRWAKPRRIFVNSMSDLFHPDVPTSFIYDVFAVMGLARHHQFQVLTKRPRRMAMELFGPTVYGSVWKAATNLRGRDEADAVFHPDRGPVGWPLPNVWLGTSIESDKYAFRARHLRLSAAAVRFLSLEPLLGPLPSLELKGIDWVIVGGESGPRARPMHSDWARDLRDRCVDAGVAFFFKQWGEWLPGDQDDRPPEARRKDDEEGRATEIEGAISRRVRKHTAGRKLDGRTWDEYPRSPAGGTKGRVKASG